MKKFVTLLLCMLPVSLFAQVNDGIRQAMDNYDYETVVTLIEPDCQDSLLLITKAQALKAMNRYPEAIGVLNSLILKDSTNTKVLIDLAECYKLTGNSRRAANCYQKAMNLRLSQNRVEMASFVSSPIEVIWIFLKKGVYKLTFEGFILSNFFFRCHKPPKRLLLQDYVQWPAGRTQFQPS